MTKNQQSFLVTMGMPLLVVGILLVAFIAYLPRQAGASGIYVVNNQGDTDDGTCNAAHCTLREAIIAANAAAGKDIITFSLADNATITLGGTQLPRITDDLLIDGDSAVNLTISGNNASRIFVIGDPPPPYPRPDKAEIAASPVVTMTQLTLIDGSETSNQGGGIFNNGDLTILDSSIRDLKSVNGGVFNNATLRVVGSSFSNNLATYYGGAIFNSDSGDLTVIDSSFTNNSVAKIYNYGGGAIANRGGIVTINDSRFTGNSAIATVSGAGHGGAIYSLLFGDMTITNSVFNDNYAFGAGGAIFSSNAGLSMTNVTVDSNSATIGGGVYSNGTFDMANSTVSNNSAASGGGGLYVSTTFIARNSTIYGNSALEGGGINVPWFADISLNNVTLSHNSAEPSRGGGIFLYGNGLDLSNSIIANSTGGDCHFDSGSIGLNVNNLIEDGSCSPDFSGDPLLGPLQDNGGESMTMALLPGSPAVDMGDNGSCESTDQRDFPRPIDGDDDGTADCDIGAVEIDDWTIFMPVMMKP